MSGNDDRASFSDDHGTSAMRGEIMTPIFGGKFKPGNLFVWTLPARFGAAQNPRGSWCPL